MNNPTHPLVKKYIRKLKRALKHLSSADRDDIIKEIEGHIYEKWENDSGGKYDNNSIRGVLGKMGPPEYIAAQYCGHRGWAKPPERHFVAKTILIIVAIAAATILGVTYFGVKYVVSPAIEMASGFTGGSSFKFGDKRGKGRKHLFGLFENELIGKMTKKLDIPAANLSSFAIDSENGRINLKGIKSDKVSIEYTVSVYGKKKDDQGDIFKDINLSSEVKDSELKIKTEIVERQAKNIKDYKIDYEITVPEDLNARVYADNGAISISDIKGVVKAESDNGAIRIDNAEKDVSARTDNGKIDIASVKGNTKIETDNGRISAINIGGDINAETDNGKIEIRNPHGNIDAITNTGKVELLLGKNFEFAFTGETDVGAIDCDFPTVKEEDKISGVVGSGKYKVNVKTDVGKIDIKRSGNVD